MEFDIIEAYLEVGFTEAEIQEMYEQELQLTEKMVKRGDVAYGSGGLAVGAVTGALIGNALARRKQKGKLLKDKNAVKKATLTGMGVGSVVGAGAGVGLNRYFKKEVINKIKNYTKASSADQEKMRKYVAKQLGKKEVTDKQMRVLAKTAAVQNS